MNLREAAKIVMNERRVPMTAREIWNKIVEHGFDKSINSRGKTRDAVFELIVNAICHRDYASHASVQVMLFSDRLEIWNPGSLPRGWTVDMLFKPHTSLPPNELIAGPMYLKGYIEKMGTGTEDVVKLCAKSGLPAPVFTEGVDFRAVLMRKKDGVLSNEIHVGTQVKTQVKTQVETHVKAQVISLARVMNGEMTTSEMMRLVGIRQRKNFHSHYISEALKSGIVEMTQPDSPRSPTQKYRLTAKGRNLLSHASQINAAEATTEA